MKHDEEYLQTLRHDMPNEPCFTGVEVQAECRAYHEHMSKQAAQRMDRLGATNATLLKELSSKDERIAELEHTRDMLLERIRLLTDEPPVITFTSTVIVKET